MNCSLADKTYNLRLREHPNKTEPSIQTDKKRFLEYCRWNEVNVLMI